MTIVLAFDTSQQWCSVSICRDGSIVSRYSEPMVKGQTEILLPKIHSMLGDQKMSMQDIHKVVTITGPGSFTGLRVGLASAQGLGVALRVSVLGVSAFRAYAHCIEGDGDVLVVIDSQKQDVYCQLFSEHGVPLKEPQALLPEEILAYAGKESFVVTGSGVAKIISYLPVACRVKEVSPGEVCDRIAQLAIERNNDFFEEVFPVYLKDALVSTVSKG